MSVGAAVSAGTASASTLPPASVDGLTTVPENPLPTQSVVASQGVTLPEAAPQSWRDAPVAAVPAMRTAPTAVTAAVFTSGEAAIRATRSATRTSLAAVNSAYTRFTMESPATRDLRGVEPSLYRGKYYRPAIEQRRLCIVRRESEGHYDVVNPSGAYRGAYQVSATLARGATWMMLDEHVQLMGESNAKRVLAQLRKTPFNKWPRYWQDAMFSTVANWERTGSGIRHWAGGRWHC